MIVLEQVLILFLFMLAGFTLSRFGMVNKEHSSLLSKLLVYVFCPCLTIKTFSTNFNIENLTIKYSYILAGAILLGVTSVIAMLIARVLTKNSYSREIYAYSLTFPNYGYIGYPLVAGLLGEEGLFTFMIFSIPFAVYVQSISFCKLTKRPFSLKGLLNAATIPLLLGMAIGLTRLPLPSLALEVLSSAGNCVGPVSMLLAGIVISEFDIAPLLKNKQSYLVAFLRLLVIPLLAGFISSFIWGDEIALYAVMFLALPCGMNTIVLPKLVKEDCSIGAQLAFITNILACATIPLVLAVFGM